MRTKTTGPKAKTPPKTAGPRVAAKKPAPTARKPAPKRPAKPAIALPAASPNGTSKQSRLITLLRSTTGATLAQMTQLTGWQPHAVRGTISGVLRKKLGLTVTCAAASASGERLYRIVTGA